MPVTIIKELVKLLDLFPGAEHQTRCFTHVIWQFDIPKAQQTCTLYDSLHALHMLAVDIDIEKHATRVRAYI